MMTDDLPDSKVHGANMGPIWGRQDPGGPHVGPMNFAIWAGDTRSQDISSYNTDLVFPRITQVPHNFTTHSICTLFKFCWGSQWNHCQSFVLFAQVKTNVLIKTKDQHTIYCSQLWDLWTQWSLGKICYWIHCWSRLQTHYQITRRQWINSLRPCDAIGHYSSWSIGQHWFM